MPKVTQLTVLVENRPGTVAKVTTALSAAEINILDFLTGTMGATGFIQLVVSDVGKAKDVLQREGYACTEQSVLYAELKNAPGSLAALAGKLAEKNINIESGYSTTMLGDATTAVILAVSDVDAAVAIT